jgi:hypothetical protein
VDAQGALTHSPSRDAGPHSPSGEPTAHVPLDQHGQELTDPRRAEPGAGERQVPPHVLLRGTVPAPPPATAPPTGGVAPRRAERLPGERAPRTPSSHRRWWVPAGLQTWMVEPGAGPLARVRTHQHSPTFPRRHLRGPHAAHAPTCPRSTDVGRPSPDGGRRSGHWAVRSRRAQPPVPSTAIRTLACTRMSELSGNGATRHR